MGICVFILFKMYYVSGKKALLKTDVVHIEVFDVSTIFSLVASATQAYVMAIFPASVRRRRCYFFLLAR